MAVGLQVPSNPYDSMILGSCKASLLLLQWCKVSHSLPQISSEALGKRFHQLAFHMDLEEPAAISRKITKSYFK